MTTSEAERRADSLVARGRILLIIVGALWLVEIVDVLLFDRALDAYGIRPKSARGLLGILFAPFLHRDYGHLFSNTVPFLVLGFLVALRGFGNLLWVSVYAAIVGGLGVWLFGDERTVHIGASGLIFGWFGYLLIRGWVEKSVGAIAAALFVGLVYGGLIFGVFPGEEGVSWEGHLFGALGGALAAWSLAFKPPEESG